jgi:hypothetical protein
MPTGSEKLFNQYVHARMTERQVTMLDRLAKKLGQTRSGVIRTLVAAEFQSQFTKKGRQD